jgi:mannose-6-phosphate isomerase-like protein (cupin superfamily)
VAAQITEPQATVVHMESLERDITMRSVVAATVRLVRLEIREGIKSPYHKHADEEVYLLVEGQVRITVGDDTFTISSSDVVVIPPFVPHQLEALVDSVIMEVGAPGQQGREDTAIENLRIQALLSEFRVIHTHLEQQLLQVEDSLDGTLRFLEMMSPSPPPQGIPESELSTAFIRSFTVGTFSSKLITPSTMLASSELIDPKYGSLATRLNQWPTIIHALEIDFGNLERIREEDIFQGLVRLGVPVPALKQMEDLGLPKSDLNTAILLSDVTMETVFTQRATRSQALIAGYRHAIRVAEEIVRLLEAQIAY